MNRELIPGQLNFFMPSTKQREVEKWVKDVHRFNIKSIYNLTWKSFYKELHRLGTKEFLEQYGYSYKKKLQLVIAKSELSQKGITLYDFERSSEQGLLNRLGNSFFDKITPQPNFNAKNHKLSTIHYLIYYHSLHFTAVSLGFSSKQRFLNFFAQTFFVSQCIGNRVQNLRMIIRSLSEVDSITLRNQLANIYDKPLAKNKNFIKYDYTLEELKLILEKEDIALVVASLGGGDVGAVNKKLQILRSWITVDLRALKVQSLESLKENTPIFVWKVKLYQLFSGQIRLLELDTRFYRPRVLHTSCMSFRWQFFSSHATQNPMEEEREIPLNLHNPSLSSFLLWR
jgi:hypothetical protein